MKRPPRQSLTTARRIAGVRNACYYVQPSKIEKNQNNERIE